MSNTLTLPDNWSIIELGSIVDVSYGKALSADMRSEAGHVPVLGSSGVVGHHDQSLVDGPCVVVGRKGAAGSVHLVMQSSWPIDTTYFIQPPSGIDLLYLYFLLVCHQLAQLDKSTAIPSLSRDDLYRVIVVIAPSAEQVRIVEKLEELLSDLDAGVAELKAAQRKLAQYRQSLLKAAVEGALTADWRAAQSTSSRRRPRPSRSQADQPQQRDPGLHRDDEGRETGAELLQRILRERRARWEQKQLAKFAEQGKAPPKGWQDKYPEPAAPNLTDLPPLPQGWVWATVEQLGRVQLGRQRSPRKTGKANPTPYIRAANITENGVDLSDVLEMEFSESEKEIFSLKYGDVLLTEASGSPEHVGRPAIWKQTQGLYCFQNTVLRFTPEGISSSYAF